MCVGCTGRIFFRDTGQRKFHVLVAGHGGTIIKSLIYRVMKRAPGVEMVLLSKNFVVVKLAQWVVVAPGKLRRFPSTVTRTQLTLALVG